jgi:predicted MFS family arabinose efflux permease
MIGIAVSSKLADKYGKRDVFGAALLIATLFIIVFIVFKPTDVRLMFATQILHMFFYGITPQFMGNDCRCCRLSEWKNNRGQPR